MLAVKEAVELAPWAEMVYGCDAPWWRHRQGLPRFKGIRAAYAGNGLSAAEYPGLRRILIEDKRRDEIIFAPTGSVGSGGNSGFQALNLAVQFGAMRIILCGFDMDDRGGKHFYGKNTWSLAHNPGESNFKRWQAAFNRAAEQLDGIVEVINCSPLTALRCWPVMKLEDALCTTL